MEVCWILVGVASAIIIAALFVLFNNNCLTVSHYAIISGKVENKLKIVHISDLHGKRFGRGNGALIAKVVAEKPDFIAITGDIIHRYTSSNIEAALELVASLKEIAPVFFVAGNHELRNKGYRFFRKQLMEAGAVVLDDSSTEICGVQVTGVKDTTPRKGKIPQSSANGKITVLLSHEPQFMQAYANAGYDVVLCGHAHGGQWRIPFIKQGLYAPSQGLFPKYTSGVHKAGKSSVVISRGLGNSRFPLRLFNRPEIVVVELTEQVEMK